MVDRAAAAPDKSEARDKEREERPDKADKAEKVADKADKPDRPEKADKPEKPEKASADKTPVDKVAAAVEKIAAADKAERPTKRTLPPAAPDSEPDFDSETSELAVDNPPSLPPMPVAGPWRSYKELVAQLAQRIVDAQRPIRVLQAIRWDNSVEEQFLKSRAREMPKVAPDWYATVDLGFNPRDKAQEFEQIARDVDAELGETDALGNILSLTALEYRDTAYMLAARGTPRFYAYSRRLYGSPKDKFPDGIHTVRDLGHVMYEILTNVDDAALGTMYERNISAEDAAIDLNERFSRYFADAAVRVSVDDTIIADAAAGSDYVKVRSGARFSRRDIDILEAHEGWVHVATSLNGQAQTVARWLSKGPPRTTAVQEGLAALMEIFTFRTYPRRARRLNDRVLAVDKAEDGASFIDVFEWFRTEGYEEDECFHNTRRVFRGGVVDGGAPFTKDACYCKGIVLNYAFIHSAIQHNRADLLPYLFVGKVAHEDVPVLARRVTDGVVKPPRYLPPVFQDLNGLAIWMAYSAFFTRLGAEKISDHYGKLFARTG